VEQWENHLNIRLSALCSNVVVNRNSIINPDSDLEIATHTLVTSVTLDARLNWWGGAIPGASTVTDLNEYHKKIAGECRAKLSG